MSERKRMNTILTTTLAGLTAAVILVGGVRTNRWELTESGRPLENPDRGFYIQVRTEQPDSIQEAEEEVRLILLACDLEGYEDAPIPEEKLEELETALREAEREHMGVIFRAAYGFEREVKEPRELERVQEHIRQLCQVLNGSSERLLAVQAGMLGSYGEWHSSRFLQGEEDSQRESRLAVLRCWEEHLSPQVKVDVRRPRFIREAWEAGVLTGRLGLHNDALLSTDSDMGTYDDPELDRAAELNWVRQHLSQQVNGGEMPTPGTRTAPRNADREFAMLHIGYLNLKYNKEIIARWSTQKLNGENAKDYLEKRLGYRLYLMSLETGGYQLAHKIAMEGLEIKLRMSNSGYGGLPEKYRVFLIARSEEEELCREVSFPELCQISNGESAEWNLACKLPLNFVLESRRLEIGLKIAPSETSAPQDCVRLANDELAWQDGVNQLFSMEKKLPIGLKTVPQDG